MIWIDIARALYLLECETEDEGNVIVNLLGTFAQIFNPLDIVVPDEYREPLVQLFGHLTFERSFAPFFDGEKTREKMIHGIQWCLGALLTNARLLS